ncbi:MAG: hypothetical protein QXO75_01325 [Nitrososphaerota archaeon]
MAFTSTESIFDDVLSNSNDIEILLFFDLVIKNTLLGKGPKLSLYDDKEIKNVEQRMMATSENILVTFLFSSPFSNNRLKLKSGWSWDEIRRKNG